MDMEIQPRALKSRLDAGEPVVLVDVRHPEEHAIARLEPSTLVPLHELRYRVDELPRDADLVVYCHHGVRSLQATMFLRQQGFGRVKSLAGGIDAWSHDVDPDMPRY